MTYESMIDNMNESTQMDFFNYTIESIGLNEAFDIKGKFESIKNAVLGFIKNIKTKASEFINWIKSKFKKEEEKTEEAGKALDKLDKDKKEQLTEKIASANKESDSSNKAVKAESPKGPIKIYEIDEQVVNKVINEQKQLVTDMSTLAKGIKDPKTATSNALKMSSTLGDKYQGMAKSDSSKRYYNDLKLIKDKPVTIMFVDRNTIGILNKNKKLAYDTVSQESQLLSQFNKSTYEAENSINRCKAEDFSDDASFRQFKHFSTQLVDNMKKIFYGINSAVKQITQYKFDIDKNIKLVVELAKKLGSDGNLKYLNK